ncbi:MAG: hypothetical protein ACI4I3_01940 [Acutalibacteraceae bacterium]
MKLIIQPEKVLQLIKLLDSNAKMITELFVPLENDLNSTYQIYQAARQKLQTILDALNQQETYAKNKLTEIRNKQEYLLQKIRETENNRNKEVLMDAYNEYETAANECINCLKAIEDEKQLSAAKWEELMHYNSCFEDGQSFLNKLQSNSSDAADNILALCQKIEVLSNQLLENN